MSAAKNTVSLLEVFATIGDVVIHFSMGHTDFGKIYHESPSTNIDGPLKGSDVSEVS